MTETKHEVFHHSKAGRLDGSFRRLLENPGRILRGQVKEGMTVLDFGCGPGYFTLELARLVGDSGKVIAADLQEEMLQMVKDKTVGTDLEKRIQTHRTSENRIGINEQLDYALAYYVLHETPNQENTLREIYFLLKPGARLYISEPIFEVSKKEFQEVLETAEKIGYKVIKKPRKLISRDAILKK